MAPSIMPVTAIRVGKRFRKDMGDIDSLAASIKDIGLISPIAVTPDGELLAGGRRLAAYKKLGWDKIPVRVMDGKR
jgi:ParB family chromosome partitioning protein